MQLQDWLLKLIEIGLRSQGMLWSLACRRVPTFTNLGTPVFIIAGEFSMDKILKISASKTSFV